MAIEKARDHGVSLVSMGNLTHTGRIGTYPEMAAAAGLAAIMFTGWAGKPWAPLVPFRGREGRLGSNPLAMAYPHADFFLSHSDSSMSYTVMRGCLEAERLFASCSGIMFGKFFQNSLALFRSKCFADAFIKILFIQGISIHSF